jgi:hypothetical protein
MQKLNNLMYSIREKGEELKGLRYEEIELEEGKNRRNLAEARGRLDRVESELKDMTNEWCNRYLLFHTSLAMLDEYQKKKRRATSGKSLMPLLTANTPDGLKPVVTEATNTELVRQISLMHEVLGSFDLHKGPLLEYQEVLNTILVDNRIEAFLLTIPRKKRVAAANMIGEFLINCMGDDAIDNLFKGAEVIPEGLREHTIKLIEYIKSDKFLVAPPVHNPESQIPRPLVQIEGLQKGSYGR